jgi:DNA (cytosine-5)-methyltransferase 1
MMGYQNFWKVLNAKDYGVPQNRERVFVVSILGCGQYLFPNPIKLEKRLKDVLEPVVDEKYYLPQDKVEKLLVNMDKEVSNTIRCGDGGSLDGKHTWDIVACASRGEKDNYLLEPAGLYIHDSEAFHKKPLKGLSRCLKAEKHDAAVVQQVGNLINTDSFGGNPQAGRVTNTLTTVRKDNYLLEPIALDEQNKCLRTDGTVGTLTTDGSSPKHNNRVIENNYRIRKLTPRECWRLMGVRDEQFNKLHDLSNTQLYKLAGNSIVVDVLMGIFKNLLVSDEGTKGQLTLF